MDRIGRGIIAGFIATLALSAVIDPLATLARAADVLPPTIGWVLHFVVGSFLWGATFALLEKLIPGPFWLRGILFGAGAWLVVMLAVMPLTRGGLFGIALGFAPPIAMLVIHLLYGVLLGSIYGFLLPEDDERIRVQHDERIRVQHDEEHHWHPLPR
jgi:hypothetical protein